MSMGWLGDESAKRVRLARQLDDAGGPPRFTSEPQAAEGERRNVKAVTRTVPSHRVFSHEAHVVGKNFAAPKRAHERLAISPLVALLNLRIGRDQDQNPALLSRVMRGPMFHFVGRLAERQLS